MLLNIKNTVSLMAQMVQNLPGMRETQILSLGWEDSPREKNGNLLQYSWLENSMDRRGWWANSPWYHKELDMTERLTRTHTYTHTHTHTHTQILSQDQGNCLSVGRILFYVHCYIFCIPISSLRSLSWFFNLFAEFSFCLLENKNLFMKKRIYK